MDMFRHVNNIAYFKYIQAARVNYWESVGIMKTFLETGTGPILASCHCDFRHALEYPGKVIINTTVTKIGETSFQFSHTIISESNVIAATATDVMVMYDFTKNKKSPISSDLRALLELTT